MEPHPRSQQPLEMQKNSRDKHGIVLYVKCNRRRRIIFPVICHLFRREDNFPRGYCAHGFSFFICFFFFRLSNRQVARVATQERVKNERHTFPTAIAIRSCPQVREVLHATRRYHVPVFVIVGTGLLDNDRHGANIPPPSCPSLAPLTRAVATTTPRSRAFAREYG